MIPSESLPMSKVGTSKNCIYLEDALVERIYLNYSYPNSLSFSIDMDLVDWLFMVGIYKSKDQYFLLLDLNDHSSAIDMMIEDGICPNTGLKLISENIAIELTEKISKLGQEYFAIDIPDFQKIMVALVSSMECKIVFSPLLCEEGYFNRINKEIVVANNNSKFCMIWAVVHEYVHYLLNSERNPSHTYEEYLCDTEEYLCDSVAFKLMTSLLGTDRITSIVESLSLKMAYACLEASDLQAKKGLELESTLSPDERCIFHYWIRKIFVKNKEGQDIIESIHEQILNGFESKFDKISETCIECAQIGLVRLSPVDNQTLYDIIINEISPIFPDEVY